MEKRAGYHRTSAGGRELIVSDLRASQVRMEKRADETRVVRGYAAVYYREGDAGTEYWLWDDIVERIQPGAFDGILGQDVRGLFNHNPDNLLGRSKAGTLRLSVDATGLHYEIDEDAADPDWQRVARKIDRGDLTGSSFAFVPKRTTWIEEGEFWIRSIEEMELVLDVGPVTYPAYGGATTGRSANPELSPIASELAAYRQDLIASANESQLALLRARLVELD